MCACLNSISDKYLPLTTFLGVGCPGLENINKFALEDTSPPSKCSQTRSFQCALRQGYDREDWSSNKEAPKRYFASPNYGSNQNHETFAYLIGNQTQCHRTLTQHHAILHQKDAAVQHHFQLCQQRNHFFFFLCLWFGGKKRRWQ